MLDLIHVNGGEPRGAKRGHEPNQQESRSLIPLSEGSSSRVYRFVISGAGVDDVEEERGLGAGGAVCEVHSSPSLTI